MKRTGLECPSVDQLKELLQASETDDPSLSQHVDQCPACQSALHHITDLELSGGDESGTSSSVTLTMVGTSPSPLNRMLGLFSGGRPNATADHQIQIDTMARIPGYSIERELGRGGMAVVYLAHHFQLNRTVAIKVLRDAHATQEKIVRFCAEATIIAGLQHPNIVQVYESGSHAGDVYFSLEYVDGGTLSEAIAGKPMRPRDAAGVMVTLARAAHFAHQRGVLHRDIKPSNVLLKLHDGADRTTNDRTSVDQVVAKLADFGLAKVLLAGAHLTAEDSVLGTPHYLAPEQLAGSASEITVATDVYALGATLYEMLVGHPPFPDSSVAAVLRRVEEEPAMFSLPIAKKIPADLRTVCLKCLEKDPRERYPTAVELADDLQRFLDGVPTLGRHAGPIAKVWRWTRRRPLTAALVGALIATLIGGTVTSTTFAIRANDQARRAALARDSANVSRDIATEAQAAYAKQSIDLFLDKGRQRALAGDIPGGLGSMLQAFRISTDMSLRERVALELQTWMAAAPQLEQWLPVSANTVAWAPDGRQLATFSKADQALGDLSELRFWDIETGLPIGTPVTCPDANVGSSAISPDGRLLIAGNGTSQGYQYRPGWANLWDVNEHRMIGRATGPRDAVTCVAWVDSGSQYAIGSVDKTIRFYSAKDQSAVGVPLACAATVREIVIDRKRQRLIARLDRVIEVWNLDTYTRTDDKIVVEDGRIASAAFSQDGQSVFFIHEKGGSREVALVRQPINQPLGANARRISTPLSADQTALTTLADGRVILESQASNDGTRYCRTGDGLQIYRSPSRVIDVDQLLAQTPRLPGKFDRVQGRAWKVLDDRRTEEAIDSETGKSLGVRLPRRPADSRGRASTSLDGELIAVVLPTSAEHPIATTAQVFNRIGQPRGARLQQLNTLIELAFSPDGKQLVGGGHAHVVTVWDPNTGEILRDPLDQGDMINSLQYSPDGKRLAVATYGKQVRLWDTSKWTPSVPPLPHGESVESLAFSPDSQVVAGVTRRAVYVWNCSTGGLIATLPFQQPTISDRAPIDLQAIFSPTGRILLTSNGGASARLWNTHDYSAIGDLNGAPTGSAASRTRYVFSSDGSKIVSGQSNGMIQLWDGIEGKPQGSPTWYENGVSDLMFDAGSRSFKTLSYLGEIQHWPVASASPMTPETAEKSFENRLGFSVSKFGQVVPLGRDEWVAARPRNR